jgi:hypothetical protein
MLFRKASLEHPRLTSLAVVAIEQTYNAPRDHVWVALKATITALGYKDVKEDPEAWTIEYRTGFSGWTWRGQQMTAVVRDDGGLSVISLEGGPAVWQLFDWGERKRLAEKVLDGVRHRVSG